MGDISSPFYDRVNPFNSSKTTFHYGIDIAARAGTDVLAAGDGTVLEVGKDSVYGNYMIIDHGNGITTKYAHLQSKPLVAEGDDVCAGDVIGKVGSTGKSTGPHLHFELRINGSAHNPANYLPSPSNPYGRTGETVPSVITQPGASSPTPLPSEIPSGGGGTVIDLGILD